MNSLISADNNTESGDSIVSIDSLNQANVEELNLLFFNAFDGSDGENLNETTQGGSNNVAVVV